MFAILFLLSVFYVGFVVTRKFGVSFIIGSVFCVTSLFILLFLTHSLFWSLVIYGATIAIIATLTYKRVLKEARKINKREDVLVWAVLLVAAFFLFQRSFSYDQVHETFLIASNLYQDFGAHIANIRYFSQGQGYLPEVPYFAGVGLLYHFMFDFYAGVLEYLGLRIDFALNIISALSFTSLTVLIYKFALNLFKNKIIAILSCALFFLGSDLSIFQLFQKYGLSIGSYYHNSTYVAGRLFDLTIDKNFLNINTYLNQRHLVFGIAVFLLVLNTILFDKKFSAKSMIFLTIIIGLLPFWHLQIVIALYFVLLMIASLFKELRTNIVKILCFSAVIVIPQILFIKLNSINYILFHPGFIIADKLSIQNFSLFWIWNLGLAIPFAAFGFFLSNTYQKKIFLCFISLFIIANLFQFSRDIFDNHKFFNVWIISVNVFSAYGIYQLFKKGMTFRVLSIISLVLVSLSGILNLLVVKNDVYARMPDSSKTKFGLWVKNNVNTSDIFLTNGEIYDPASIAGDRTFLGRLHYIFLYGGDPSKRIQEKNVVLSGESDEEVRTILKSNKITYIIIYKKNAAPNINQANSNYLGKHFKKVYEDDIATIYKI